MERATPPPDFRFVWLDPGPTSARTLTASMGVGVGAAAAGVAVGGGSADMPVIAGAAAMGTLAGWAVFRRLRAPTGNRAAGTPMAIVPWGVIVHRNPEARVLRWAAIRKVDVEFVHEMDNATPSIRWSLVTVDTDREQFTGRAHGTASLERLQAHLDEYADEASSAVALDVDGETPADEIGLEPVFEQVLAEARRLLHTGEIAERLSMVAAGYREPPRETEATLTELRRILQGRTDAPADPRPLAAVIAAELDARSLLDDVASLSASPHPLVAGVARAAALKLGGSVGQIGAVSEVSEFLPESDVEQLEAWIEADPAC